MFKDYLIFVGFFSLLSGKSFGSEEGMPQLNPEYWLSQIFWVIIIFGTMYIILWKIILPKISQNLENRKSQIITDLDDAQKFRDQSEKKLDEYNKIINQAKKDAKKILDDARKKIIIDLEKKKEQFKSEIDKEIEDSEKEIKKLELSSFKSINQIAIETSSEIIKKIVGSEINTSSVSAIVNDVSKKEIKNIYDN